jgi:SAM-dependent methyltransferase
MTLWDSRYDRPDYLFGTEPAAFLTRHARVLPPKSRILCVADGEGRNSVYLAGLGHDVTAFDQSGVALAKARRLAQDNAVTVTFAQSGIEAWDWSQPYDAVLGVFIQFIGPEGRGQLFADIARAIRPGGVLLLHGYAPRQVGYGTGGPSAVANMYTLDLLRDSFAGWDVLHAADYDAEISEGVGHSGGSGLIDFVARKPG